LRIAFWNGIALLCFVASIWLCVWAGFISRRYPLLLLSGIWIVAGIAAVLWVEWRASRNDFERQQCEKLLAKFRAAETSEYPPKV
jgi:hypothetical protein